jgi:lipoprotein-releasing system permease protein
MNSLSSGFTKFSRDEIFKANAHIKIYKADVLSLPIIASLNGNQALLINPQITSNSKRIINPKALVAQIKSFDFVTDAICQTDAVVFYNKGSAQLKGTSLGVDIAAYNRMYSLKKYMVAGSLEDLSRTQNGIILGSGIAKKLAISLLDNVTLSSSLGITKTLKVVGIFESGSNITDESRSFINTKTAQQLLQEGPSYVSAIYVNTTNPDFSVEYASKLQEITTYNVEDWTSANADMLAGDKTRSTMMGAISLSILLVASFGIYTILSATISQKIDDIAILKATGFLGSDVIKLFVLEAIIMGLLGTLMGLGLGATLISCMSKVYMGGPVGYFPISFVPSLFVKSFCLGIFLTVMAGFFPAYKASKVDPVKIFRK